MIIYTGLHVRSSTDIAWFSRSNDHTDLEQTMKQDGRLVSTESILVDEYTLRNTQKFVDQAAFDFYMSQPCIVESRSARQAYNSANGIVSTNTKTEI